MLLRMCLLLLRGALLRLPLLLLLRSLLGGVHFHNLCEIFAAKMYYVSR